METTTANPEEVERLVAILMNGLQASGGFTGANGMVAAITFTYRFAQAVIQLSPMKLKQITGQQIAMAMRRTASMVEFGTAEMQKETVH